jgi:hypothetical protein
MKRYFLLTVLLLLLKTNGSNAQPVLSISPVYQVGNDTLPAYSTDSLHVWVKNTGSATFSDYVYVGQSVQDSAGATFHIIDSIATFVPVVIAPGDSLKMTFLNYYDIDTSRYHYDINVIVIWPIAISGGVNIGDSLSFIEVITLQESIREIDLQELIRAYPNPVSHDLNLESDRKTAIEEVRIYNNGGQCVKIINDPSVLCTDNWEKGVYLLRIRTRDGRGSVIRVIKK